MSKLITFIYGLLIVLVPISAWLGFFSEFLPYILILLGAVVFFTPIISHARGVPPLAPNRQRVGLVNFIRRRIFGLYLFFVGIISATGIFEEWTANISVYSTSGQLILLVIGLIYFVASFSRTRTMKVASY